MLQKQLEEFQSRLSTFREFLGVIGDGKSSDDEIPDVSSAQERLFESLTTEAITGQVRFVMDSETVILNKIRRIEHQSWVRGMRADGTRECVNLMDVNQIEVV